MSWTIEEQTHQQNLDLYDLEAAISAAESNQILMFCAASDQGANATENCYPGKWNKCIKIGAATALGDKCTWVPNNQFEYLLPGKGISFKQRTPDGFSITQKSGSSIATALASGLAGLLLYCDQLTCTSAEERLQGQGQMRDAFRRLTGTEKSDSVFVKAHKWFGTKFWQYVANGINEAETNQFSRSKRRAVAKPRPTEWTPEANEALLRIMEEIKVSVRIA
ncbi:uncharacterized protein TrAtP1_009936 [Trichoderma atroviride]|uniref:uncharacterized protein n=1 Tax=Hypocrea atroviridis TaxID=63577 RepID=UPI003316D141|nr:hypothetical protein TrAtP1_009936 [Trichoderma atroviride]